ncbi:phosphonoacetaldehyde reductase [archaeon AH-315-M20]|nr:phosphonoacetaldehyde reductase [archaeon AH-315-M20]
MKQREYLGFNSIDNLKPILDKHNPKNIFLVTGRKSYETCGAKSILDITLQPYKVTHFYDFEVNPKIKDVEKGIKNFRENECDFVIAVGGGSALDIAKAINLFSNNEESVLLTYTKNPENIKNKGKPLVAIPTTSGSGSEATRFAVLYKDKTKCSFAHVFILPDYAIVDPQFTINLPKYITACTGMDAFSQAVESYWSTNLTDESKEYARKAIKLIIENLQDAVNNPNEKSREAMAKAAHLAGKAINISFTTSCHAIAPPITSYFGVPHGHAVALTLAQMLIYNSQVTEDDLLDKRGLDYVKNTINELVALIGARTVEEAGKKIKGLMEDIGLITRLSELGIKTNEDVDLIIRDSFNPNRLKSNPRLLTKEALRKDILSKIM